MLKAQADMKKASQGGGSGLIRGLAGQFSQGTATETPKPIQPYVERSPAPAAFAASRPNAPKGMSLAKKGGGQNSMMKAFEEEGITHEETLEEAPVAVSSLPTEGIVIQLVNSI